MATTTDIRADLYPSRGATEVSVPRKDPVVWNSPDAPGPVAREDLASFERDGFLTVDPL
ncbi:ectoine hydroxylase, partial [Streptomyces massasporeus]